MKYRLKQDRRITIDESVKESFKEIMGWTEDTFKHFTEIVEEEGK